MDWYKISRKRRRQMSRRISAYKLSLKDQFLTMSTARYVALGMLVMVVLGIVCVGGLFVWYARDLPQPDKIVRTDGFATRLMDRNGEILYEIFVDEQRTPIDISQVPETLKQATIAVEDKNFYVHGGFDPKGIIRAAFNTIFRGKKEGGSTLTQQLVKNVLLTSERRLSRKIKEVILAIQIESKYNKDEILQMYLNEAPYGGTAWGVATAAQRYFGKDVEDLDLVESAILAGMPQRPSVYSPYGSNPTAYIARTKGVLRRMREDGYITAEEEASAAASLADVDFSNGLTRMRAPHFSMFVKDQLIEMFGEDMVERGGLQVTTSLDLELHDRAQQIVSEEIAKLEDQDIGNGAAMIMDPISGEILSMVGSKDYFAKDYDGQVNVVTALRQPGSTIKPVTYAAAFAKGYTPAHMLMDVKTDFPSGTDTPYTPVNYDGQYRGPIQLRFALGSSLNVPAVKLLALVGLEDVLKLAYDMGLETLEPTKENMSRFGLSVTLGGGEVRLFDLVRAYSVFANGGVKVEPVSILKVVDRDGNVLYEHQPIQGDRVLDESVTFLINHVLSDNNARLLTFGPNSYLNMGNRPVAVKTGTTNDKRDNWTIGWSTSGVVGVWVGNNDNSPMSKVASGVTGASPIWRSIMLEVLNRYPASEWHVPDDVEAVRVDAMSGYPEHDGFPARSEYVIRGTLPPLPDPIHTKLKLCKGQDKLATDVDVLRGEYDEKEYFVVTEDVTLGDAPSWQEGINAWIAGQDDSRYHPPTDYCDSVNDVIVDLREPNNEKNYDGNTVKVDARVITQGDIKHVDIFVDGNQVERLTSRPYETNLELNDGVHRIYVEAERSDGKKGRSDVAVIGVGGVSFDADREPTPTPTPTLVPEVTVELSPTPTPSSE